MRSLVPCLPPCLRHFCACPETTLHVKWSANLCVKDLYTQINSLRIHSSKALKVPTPRHADSSRLAVIIIASHTSTKFNVKTHLLLWSAEAQPKETTMDTDATWAIADRWADSHTAEVFPTAAQRCWDIRKELAAGWDHTLSDQWCKMKMYLFELRERPDCINKKYKDNLLFSFSDLYFSIPGSNLEQQIANYKDMFSPLFLASTRWQKQSGLKPSLHSSAGFVHIFTASSENHIAPSVDLAFFI